MSNYFAAGGGDDAALARRRASGSALRSGKPVDGFMLASSLSLDFVQLLEPRPGFIVIEMEHSHFEFSEVATCLRMLNLLGVLAFVRIPEIRYEAISKVLDAGADGVLVPRIRTMDELAEVVDAMRLPPMGSKGIGGYDFQGGDLAAKLAGYNDEKILLIQIETADALTNVDELLGSGQVAAAIIGPFDLSQSLGVPGQFSSAVFSAAVDAVVEAAARAGVPSGAMMPTPALAADWSARGMSIRWIGTEVSLFMAGYRQARQDYLP